MNNKHKIEKLKEQIKHLRSKINEVLSSPYPYKIDFSQASAGRVSARFKAAADEYFYLMELSIYLADDDHSDVLSGEVSFSDSKGKQSITGKGDAFRVMATVIDITRELVTSKEVINQFVSRIGKGSKEKIAMPPMIEVITFLANTKEPSRVSLYKRIASNIPGFTLAHSIKGKFLLLSDTLSQEAKKSIEKKARYFHKKDM